MASSLFSDKQHSNSTKTGVHVAHGVTWFPAYYGPSTVLYTYIIYVYYLINQPLLLDYTAHFSHLTTIHSILTHAHLIRLPAQNLELQNDQIIMMLIKPSLGMQQSSNLAKGIMHQGSQSGNRTMHHAPGQPIGQQGNASCSRTSLGQSRHVSLYRDLSCMAQAAQKVGGEREIAGSWVWCQSWRP
jgi:hypothetical protein